MHRLGALRFVSLLVFHFGLRLRSRRPVHDSRNGSDETGAAVPRVSITVVNTGTQVKRTAVTENAAILKCLRSTSASTKSARRQPASARPSSRMFASKWISARASISGCRSEKSRSRCKSRRKPHRCRPMIPPSALSLMPPNSRVAAAGESQPVPAGAARPGYEPRSRVERDHFRLRRRDSASPPWDRRFITTLCNWMARP